MASHSTHITGRQPGLPDLSGFFDHPGPRLAVLLAVAVVVFLRVPEILLEGRFWAEGATVYFRAAVQEPWAETFFSPFGGYYSLLNRMGAEAATWVPLEAAPLVTGYLSFAIMLLPSLMILFLPNRLGILGWRRCLLGALIAFPTMGAEVWLNLVNNQFWLGVAAGLVLMIDTRERWTIWFLAPLLVIAVLTGPVATFLLPLFLLSAVIERDRSFIQLTLIVCAGALLQGFLMIDTMTGDHPRGADATPRPSLCRTAEALPLPLPRRARCGAFRCSQNGGHRASWGGACGFTCDCGLLLLARHMPSAAPRPLVVRKHLHGERPQSGGVHWDPFG